MVVLEKQNDKNGIVLYHYYPNGGDEYGYGVIAIDTKTGEIGIKRGRLQTLLVFRSCFCSCSGFCSEYGVS